MKVILLFFLIPLVSSAERQNLGGEWTLSGSSPTKRKEINVKANVPGGVYSDLMAANEIGDIFYGNGDNDYQWVGRSNWNYSLTFTVTDQFLEYKLVNLVFEGLDTFSTIFLNGETIGISNSMFLQYVIDVKRCLQSGENSLVVAFASPVSVAAALAEEQDKDYNIPPDCPDAAFKGECHVNQVRKMQASFSWDWGPSFPSVGIWKDVYLEGFDGAVIRDVLATPVIDGDEKYFRIDTYLSLGNTPKVSGSLDYVLTQESDPITLHAELDLTGDEAGAIVKTTDTLGGLDMLLWWPNGYGEQNLYNLTVTFTSDNEQDSKSLRVGFRTVELIQEELNPGLSFYFKVNDVPIFAKGSNEIPLNILPELGQSPETIDRVLETAKDTNMNMLRVWGGGVYESDYFYEKTDELGILVWQDFMFACALYPTEQDYLKRVSEEVRHQVKRLHSHPSVVLWSGNNENEGALVNNWFGITNFTLYKSDYVKLYVDTIEREVKATVLEALFVLSSPSNGKETEDEGGLSENPGDDFYGDVHFYDYSSDSWDISTFPIPRFASEYGYQSMPSLDSWLTATDDVQNLAPTSDFLDRRQHHPDGNQQNVALISQQLALPDASHAHYIEAFVYFSQILQAQSVKIETEYYRSFAGRLSKDNRGNTMGALYWQLNDVWVAPTWSGLDFTGRWKMLQYFAKDFFAPTIITGQRYGNDAISIFATTDLVGGLDNVMSCVHVYKWDSLEIGAMHMSGVSLEHLKTVEVPYDLNELMSSAGCGTGDEARKNCFVYMHIQDANMTQDLSPINYLFLEKLKDSNLVNANVEISSVVAVGDNGNVFEITLKTDAIALFVWLDSHELSGRFSKNGFLQVNAEEVVTFTAEQETGADELKNVLTVTHLRDTKYL